MALTVGIIVVTGLIIGGLFWIRGAGEQARQSEATKIAQQQLEEESRNDVALNEGDEANKDETKSEEESSSNGSGSTSTNGQLNTESQTGSQGQSGSNSTSGNASNSGSSSTGATELPQTGIDDAAPAFVLALLAFSIGSYISSRRQLQ